MTQKVEALVIGAGVIGSSVAMHLAKLGMKSVRVIDFDLEGTLSSSELNAGGVRATWVHPLNIEMSRASIDYFDQVADDVGYRASGYLWLHSPQKWQTALQARELQNAKNWPVEAWDTSLLRRRIPFLDKTEGVGGAIFAPRDGLINPNLLKNHYRAQGRMRGVVYEDRTLLREVKYHRDGRSSVGVVAERFESVMSHEMKLEIAAAGSTQKFSRNLVEYEAECIVNCAGPWASWVAQILGYTSPSHPVRRQVSIFDCREVDLSPFGMIVDTSGVYFHPEATNGLAGYAIPQEPAGVNYRYDGESFFNEYIWPALYERSSHFERLKHLTGWAGLYEVSPDEAAVLGAVHTGEAGHSGRIFEAHSFSGHGVMHSYSAGQGLAERIVKEKYETLNLEPLSAERFALGKPIREELFI